MGDRVASRSCALAVLVAEVVLTAFAPFADAPHQAYAAGRFVGTPAFNEQGLALAVFEGGTTSELAGATAGAGASGAWAQDSSGRFHLLAVGAPAFVTAAFDAAFPGGFAVATAVTLVRQPAAAQVQRASLLPPGSALPSDAQAAASVKRNPFEHRRRNVPMNATVPEAVSIPGYVRNDGGTDDRARALAGRVTGNFTGTTDEILQWGAHKWGFDEDFVRGLAAVESWWEQTAQGDSGTSAEHCAAVGQPPPCAESYGILQVRPPYHRGTWPDAATSTAFNVDYALMVMRVAYEGYMTWLTDLGFDDYRAGDEWGSAGVWVSGRWYTDRAREYIEEVRHWQGTKPWTQDWFQGGE